MQQQRVNVKVVFPDGTLVDFNKEYRVLDTKVRIWDGQNDYSGKPVGQKGISITHTVSRGDWVCIMEGCDWRGENPSEHPHSTTFLPQVLGGK